MHRIFTDHESNVRSYCRNFPAIFQSARGAILTDISGREWIDFLCGAGAVNYGHNHPALKRAVLDYLADDGLVHGLDLHSTAKAQFLEAFQSHILKPRSLEYRVQFTGPTGANAVEAAFKLARKVTGRRGIVAFTHGYHGLTLGALAATANNYFRGAANVTMGDVTFMPYDGWLGAGVDTLAVFERYLKDPSSGMDLPAAVVVETTQGEGGINVASVDWLRGLADLCRRYDILLIIDDIQAGCGRTGPFFSFERAQLKPDLVTMSKSIGAYGLPMSLVLIRPDLDVWKPGEHTGTFRGNNLAFIAATAAIETFWVGTEMVRTVRARAGELRESLRAIAAHHAGRIEPRGIGLLQGFACDEPALAKAISRAAFERGLIVECAGAHDEVIKTMPPLTIGSTELARGCDLLREAVDAAVEGRP
ncbi:MAG: diaminobutyrate--2-oxoglutarate transaminase [Planctomycetes bacterium]|nr:diaminobutyrate--2-oxoglutarate transaminase [Planctomycetota bacterium]